MTDPLDKLARTWRRRVLVSTWLSYVGFYFCRKNFVIAKASLRDALEISNSELAHIFTAYLVAYMVGQFVTGVLGRKVALRLLLLAGMAISAVCNVLFGFAYLLGPAGYWPFLALMVVNGLSQASGWPGNVGVLSNWLRREDRGRVMAMWATSYQLGSILAKSFAALMLAMAGALWSFWGAVVVMLGVWAIFYLAERDSPEDAGLPALVESDAGGDAPFSVDGDKAVAQDGIFAGWDRQTIATVLWMGACYFVFKFLRYALDSWSPLAMIEIFHVSPANAGFISTAFDWVGFLGVLVAGFVSDRFYGGRRYQTILIMTCGMLVAFIVLALFGTRSIWLFGISLSLCGFMLMGPDSLLSGVGAIDVGGRRHAVLAAGMINGVGSAGPILQEEAIGWLLDRYGHMTSFYLMVAVAALGVIGTAYLASRSRRKMSSL